MSRRLWLLCALLLSSTLTLYSNCGLKLSPETQGTNTGNVLNPFVASAAIPDSLCGAFQRCYPRLDLKDCPLEVGIAPGIPPKLGVDPNHYANLYEIIEAENLGILAAEVLPANQCLAGLTELSCDQIDVFMDFKGTSSEPYRNVSQLLALEPECLRIFRQ